ncbi:MAG: Fe-S oxidoreductase [Desulfobulbus propionicus]|nr:MAG: Fe-S oxidoreductase [Desulfobulbus propionicus]
MEIPEERHSLQAGVPFAFHCHPDVSCFLTCCHKVKLHLLPYDVLRLKRRLDLPSAVFIRKYARIGEGAHPYFPGVLLNMSDAEGAPCPFLCDRGCSVYPDRPSACRTYPLERGVERQPLTGKVVSHWWVVQHPYCQGHGESRQQTLAQWQREQQLREFNRYNDLWAEVNAFFATNPWGEQENAQELQQLAFMVCYNLDDFRGYVQEHRLLKMFKLNKAERRAITTTDEDLLCFGFKWLQHVLGNRRTLSPR